MMNSERISEQTPEKPYPWRTTWSLSIPRDMTSVEIGRLETEMGFSMPWGVNDTKESTVGYSVLESPESGARGLTLVRVMRIPDSSGESWQPGCGFDIVTTVGTEGDEQRWQSAIDSVEQILGLTNEDSNL